MKKCVLVAGSANMDITLPITRLPQEAQTLSLDGGIAYSPGGNGANMAVALSALGGDAVLCTRLGNDSHGETLYDYYKDCGVGVSHITVDRDYPTGCAVFFEDRQCKRATLYYPGANARIDRNDIENALHVCPDALLLSMEIGKDAVISSVRYAAEHGIPVFLDGGPGEKDFPLESLAPLTVFSPNEEETELYTGIAITGADSMLAASMELLRRVKAEYIVIKLGDRGAYICNGRHFKFVTSFLTPVIDATAAGDAFMAAVCLRFLENGGDIGDAVYYGCAAGAITVSRKGASRSVPSKAEMLQFLEQQEGRA